MTIRLIIAIVAFGVIALAGSASAGVGPPRGCCACLDDTGMGDCPASGEACFTWVGTAENCSAQCAKLGCPSVAASEGAVCGEGGFAGCVVIDPGAVHAAPALSFGMLVALSLMLLGHQIWRSGAPEWVRSYERSVRRARPRPVASHPGGS